MSAIVAIFGLDGKPIDPSLVERMLDRLEHRGTDDRGVWCAGNVALGHNMRWTTPESLDEKLPFKGLESRAVITCDGRIDNRKDILRKLSIHGSEALKVADSEIILKAYEKWGEDCPKELIGDFVFAIWDPQERKLFCARDPLGIKHFYYCYLPGKIFALASEIKALLEIDAVPNELNEEHLTDYLILNSDDKVSTFYKGIRRLPATNTLQVTAEHVKIREYWSPDFKEIQLKNDSEYHEAFREKFEEAVNCRLRSAFPMGAMLSGGLDSSAVVCVASQTLRNEGRDALNTYSAVFPTLIEDDPRIDETRFMRSVIESSRANAHFIEVDDASPLQNMDKIVWHTDHPVGYLNVYMDSQIFKHCEANGIRVLLTGHDGDTTVTHGYGEFEQLARRGHLVKMIREARAMNRNMPSRAHSLKRLAWHRGAKLVIPQYLVGGFRTLRFWKKSVIENAGFSYPLHLSAVNSGFKTREQLERRIETLRQEKDERQASPARDHWNSLTTGLFSNMHEQVEKLSAAYGIEPRHPFFDRRLIEFCIALPAGQRIFKGWTRSIFRFAMKGILPEDVRWRTGKANLGAHIKLNLFKYGMAEVEQAIGPEFWKIAKYLDGDSLQSACLQFRTDPNRKDSEALLLLTSMYLMSWLGHSGFATPPLGTVADSTKRRFYRQRPK